MKGYRSDSNSPKATHSNHSKLKTKQINNNKNNNKKNQQQTFIGELSPDINQGIALVQIPVYSPYSSMWPK